MDGFRGSANDLGITAASVAIRAPAVVKICGRVVIEGLFHPTRTFMGVPAGLPVYLCWDMDVFDPPVAPGVCIPTWGGLSVREGIELMGTLTRLNIVAADFNTVSPPQDVGGMATHLCAHMMMEAMLLPSRQFGLLKAE